MSCPPMPIDVVEELPLVPTYANSAVVFTPERHRWCSGRRLCHRWRRGKRKAEGHG